MNKNWIYFIGGVVVGIILTTVALYFIGKSMQQQQREEDLVQYLEQPVGYEDKSETSFKVFQVLGNAALAKEVSDKIGSGVMYYGNTVVILGKNYYSDQVVIVKKPMRVGTYSYTNNGGVPMTVPVIDGEMK